PGNVAEAVRTGQTYGVDVSSRVETSPGVNYAGNIAASCAAARHAYRGQVYRRGTTRSDSRSHTGRYALSQLPAVLLEAGSADSKPQPGRLVLLRDGHADRLGFAAGEEAGLVVVLVAPGFLKFHAHFRKHRQGRLLDSGGVGVDGALGV